MKNIKLADKMKFGHLEDAYIEAILDASPDELRSDLLAAGEDPDAYTRSALEVRDSVLLKSRRAKLEYAKIAAADFRVRSSATVLPIDRERASAALKSIFDKDAPQMMLAARRGTNLSEADQDALKDALAALKVRKPDGEQ